ncbi:DUF1611 domain-containing protein [Thalassoglobus sp. JC818]|uniref:DUF1611 domain-containing protein n=1 Tax=Thalassoglobus sp. JC818 TaxID=3232136 RepID=UPI003458EDFD
MPQPTSEFLSHHRIALLTDGYSTPFLAKTAISMLRYRTADIAAVIDRTATAQTADELFGVGGEIPVVNELSEVPNADALYVGIAPPGGKLPEEWQPIVRSAIRRKLDVVSGLHDFLTDNDEFVELLADHGGRLIDVRKNSFRSTATGAKFRSGSLRIHAVGHDCSVGKMVTMIELERALKELGHDAKFLATGQTGIMVSGAGVPIDCVVADFINGAAENLVLESQEHDILLVEGQGSVAHPAFSGVTVGLLHGCAPDGLIFCYEAGREEVKGLDSVPLVPILQQMLVAEAIANLRHPCKVIGIGVNTRTLNEEEAEAEISRISDETGLPACDVYREGPDKLVEACLNLRKGAKSS